MSVSADRQPDDAQEPRNLPMLLNEILGCKPEETQLQQYRACLKSLSEEAISGDLEATSLFLSSLRSAFESCPLKTSEEVQQVTETLNEVCRYGHTLFEAPAQGQPGTVGETAQVHFAALKKGVSRLHAHFGEANVELQVGNACINILQTMRHCLNLMDIAFFSQRWVDRAGPDTFSLISSEFRAFLKDDIVPLVTLACKSHCPGAEDEDDEALYQQLHNVLCDLLAQGSKCAHIIDGSNKDLSAKEFRSFDVHFFSDLIDELAANVVFAFGKLLDSPDTNQLQVFRFWMQALMKVLTTIPTTVLLKARELLKLGCQMYDSLGRTREAAAPLDQGISLAIENAAKRYVSCLLDVAESQDGIRFFQVVTVELAEPSAWHPSFLKGRAQLAMDLLAKIPCLHGSAWPSIVCRFLPWVMAAFQQCQGFMDDSQMQLRLLAGFATCVCCLSRVDPEDPADYSQEILFLLLRMALDLHPHTQQLLLHILMVLEPQILGDFCKVLVKLGISFAAVAHMEDNHQVDIVLDSTAHLAGQVLRMAPKDIKDTVSLDLLKECMEQDSPLNFFGLRNAARLLGTAYVADTPPHIRQELLRHLDSTIKSAYEFNETGRQYQSLYLSLLCIEELSYALGSSQVVTEYQEQLGILLENILEADSTPSVVKGMSLHIAALFEDTKALRRIHKFLPNLAANLSEAAAPCAVIAQHSSRISDNPAELFHSLFQAPHWALRFETCQSLVRYARQPDTGNFRMLIPMALLQKSEAGESPLIVQLQQHIQRKSSPSNSLSQRPTDCEVQEATLLGETSKDLPFTIGRIIARHAADTERQGMKEEADDDGEVFMATGIALKQMKGLVEKHGAQLLKDPRFAKVHEALSQLLARVQDLRALTSSSAGAQGRFLVSKPENCDAFQERGLDGTVGQASQ